MPPHSRLMLDHSPPPLPRLATSTNESGQRLGFRYDATCPSFPAAEGPGPEACAARPVRVVLADDECLFRASLRQLLAAPAMTIGEVYGVNVGPGFDVVGEAGTGEDTVRVVQSVRPDVLLLDLSMPRMSGLDALREMAAAGSSPRVLVLAGTIDRPQLLAAVHLGARGLLLKNATDTYYKRNARFGCMNPDAANFNYQVKAS